MEKPSTLGSFGAPAPLQEVDNRKVPGGEFSWKSLSLNKYVYLRSIERKPVVKEDVGENKLDQHQEHIEDLEKKQGMKDTFNGNGFRSTLYSKQTIPIETNYLPFVNLPQK